MADATPSRLDSAKKVRKATRRAARRTLWEIICLPGTLICCCCRSFGGVMALMRHENTREFALAVVIGNAFESFIDAFSDDIVMPLFQACPGVTNQGWAFGAIPGGAFLLVGGPGKYCVQIPNGTWPFNCEFYDPFGPVRYATLNEADADGAIYINAGHFVGQIISFILKLLNIYWFFGCVAKTEAIESGFKWAYTSVHDHTVYHARNVALKSGIPPKLSSP